MAKLEIKLPNGSTRYVTRIDEDDAACSIYESSALMYCPENVKKLKRALKRWPEIEVIEPEIRIGCWIMNGKIMCHGRADQHKQG